MSMRYSLICFDAGFTLIEARRSMRASVAAVLAEEGRPPTEEALQRAWELADRWFWEEYHRPGNTTWASDARIKATWRHYHQLMLAELGVPDVDGRIVAAVAAAHFGIENWRVYPDVLPVLETLRAAGFPLGIVSDWGAQLPQICDALGLSPYLSFVLASGSVGLAKPDPRFYQLAAQTAGVAPTQALMVGDSYQADVLGARAAGMDALLLDRAGSSAAADVTIIRSLDELPAWIGMRR